MIAGTLNCSGGRFENPGGVALSADGANIGRGVILGSGFKASGLVRFAGATIGGSFDYEDAVCDAIVIDGAVIGGRLA